MAVLPLRRVTPRPALSAKYGVGSGKVVLMAWGEGKAPVIRRAVEGEVTNQVAASYLQQHPNARIVLDSAAAAELTRFKTPWLLGNLEDFGLTPEIVRQRLAVPPVRSAAGA